MTNFNELKKDRVLSLDEFKNYYNDTYKDKLDTEVVFFTDKNGYKDSYYVYKLTSKPYIRLFNGRGIYELTTDDWYKFYEEYLRYWDKKHNTVEYLKWRDELGIIPYMEQPEFLSFDLQYKV